MSFIEGTATISIETLDSLRENEKLFKSIKNNASGLIERIDSEQYEKKQKEIDAIKEISDDDLTRLLREARSALRIIVSTGCLRRLIQEFMDSEKSNAHYELSEMTKEEFAKIPLVLESGQRLERAGGQQEKSVCEMCEAYMEDKECDMKEDCPAAGIAKRLKEAEKTIKIKTAIIEKRDKEISKLREKLSDLELEKSYMINPMAIGDRREMGG